MTDNRLRPERSQRAPSGAAAYARTLYVPSGAACALLIILLLAAPLRLAMAATATPTSTPLPTATPNPLLDPYCAYVGLIDRDSPGGAVVSNTILVTGGAVTGRIPVPGSPGFIAKSPDEATLYVSLGDDQNPVNEIALIDTATNRVTGSIPIDAAAIAFAPDGAHAYAVCLSRRMPSGEYSCPTGEGVSIIDTKTRSLVGDPISLGLGADPWSIAVAPDGRRAYVGTNRETVSVIDLDMRQVVDAVPIAGGRFRDVALSRDGSLLYVAPADYTNQAHPTAALTVIDTATDAVRATIPICTTDPVYDVEPDEIVVSRDGQRIYVVCSSGLNVINTSTNHVILTVPGIGGRDSPPNGIALTPDGRFLYGSESGDCLQPLYPFIQCPIVPVMDTATTSLLATIFQGVRGTEETTGITVTAFQCRPVSASATPTASLTPSATPTVSATVTATHTRTASPTLTWTQTATSTPSATPTQNVTFPGDADCNNQLTANDVEATGAALFDPIARALCAADCNQDGSVTSADLTCVMKLLSTLRQ